MEEEWPDASELAAERAAAREAATPVPERVWALRNVAATAAMSGPAGVGRAVQMLDKAIGLKEEWVGGAEHPSAPLPLDFKAESEAHNPPIVWSPRRRRPRSAAADKAVRLECEWVGGGEHRRTPVSMLSVLGSAFLNGAVRQEVYVLLAPGEPAH